MEKEKAMKITRIILKIIAVAGIVSLAALMPNIFQVLGAINKKSKYKPKYYIKTVLGRLRNQDLIKFYEKNGKTFFGLTEKGEEKLMKYRLGEIAVEKPKKWDQKWRIVIFDIQEIKKNTRNLLRKELINLGFIKLQNSVWVYPYDCKEIMILLKSYLKVSKDILYIEAVKVENDKWLRKAFDLN